MFRIIEATRLWNASHGGVYGKLSAESPSNPYLLAEEKDIATPDGTPLTLLNPAYMTRQLAKVIESEVGVRIHLTSLKPINPNNRALDWEAAGLRAFERGERYFYELV